MAKDVNLNSKWLLMSQEIHDYYYEEKFKSSQTIVTIELPIAIGHRNLNF